jgi:PhzF family phenazine biosynthesis protein
VRIFTPNREIPFAGHPTLGSAHAALETGFATARDGLLIQECGAGRLPIRIEADGAVWVGGRTQNVIDGWLRWECVA